MNLRPLGYEKREAGFRCLAWSLDVAFTWVNGIRLVSDEASGLSVHSPFRGIPPLCVPRISGKVRIGLRSWNGKTIIKASMCDRCAK